MKTIRQPLLAALCLALLLSSPTLAWPPGGNGGGKPGGGGEDPPPPEPPFSYARFSLALPHPDDPSVMLTSDANGMNNNGDVVGNSGWSLFDGANLDRRIISYVYHFGTDTIIPLNSHLTDEKWWIHNAHDINDQGEIIGLGYRDEDGDGNLFNEPNLVGESVLLTPTGNGDYDVSRWGTLGGAGDVNNSGDIIDGEDGRSLVFQVGKPVLDIGSSVENGGGSSAITDRDANGDILIVGSSWMYDTATDTRTFLPPLYSKGRNPGFSDANDVANNGIIAGETSVSRKDNFAAIYLSDGWYSLGSLASSNEWNDSYATSISNDSEFVIGVSYSGDVSDSPNQLGFLYVTALDTMFSVNTQLPEADRFTGTPNMVEVNNNGAICGDFGRAFLLVPLLP